jgi:hypothetical protein
MFEDISKYGGDFSLQTDIYASTGEAPPKLFLSRDRGTTFTEIPPSPNCYIDRWTVNATGSLLTVEHDETSGDSRVFIAHPNQPNTPIAIFPNPDHVNAIAASPRGDFYLFASVSGTYQLYRQPVGSTAPLQFVSTQPGFSGTISNMWIIENNNIENIYFAFYGAGDQLYRSTDGGNTFFWVNDFAAAVIDIVPHRGNHPGNIVLAISTDSSTNIWSSADGGTFTMLSSMSALPSALHVDRNNRLYAATQTGLFFSDDAQNWQQNSSFGPSDVASDYTGRVYIVANSMIFASDTMGVEAFVLNSSVPNALKLAVVSYIAR